MDFRLSKCIKHFTYRVIFSHIPLIFTFSADNFSHIAIFSRMESFSHLRVPQCGLNLVSYLNAMMKRGLH